MPDHPSSFALTEWSFLLTSPFIEPAIRWIDVLAILIENMGRPELFNFSIHIHENKFLAANLVIEVLGELRHVFVGVENYKLDACHIELEIMGDTPFAFVCVIDGFSPKIFGPLKFRWTIDWPKWGNERANVILPLLFLPMICPNVIGGAASSSENMVLAKTDAIG